MENKNENNKVKKMKVDFNSKNSIFDFYNSKIKVIHMVVCIIAIVIFAILFFINISDIKNGYMYSNKETLPAFAETAKNNALLDFLVIFAGITPYFFLSVIGLIQIPVLVNEMGLRYYLEASTMPTLIIGGIIQVIGLTLCVALGIYYCILSTKKNKYYKFSNFGLKDLKMHFYEIRKDEKKLDEYKKKTQEKAKEAEKNNIKIPYINLAIIGVISFVIQIIGVLIAKI